MIDLQNDVALILVHLLHRITIPPLQLSSDSDTSIIDPLRESSSDESARAQPIAAQAGPAFGGLNEDSDVEDEDEVHAPDVAPLVAESEIEDIRVIQEFNESNQTATLANGKLEGLAIPRLQNHIQVPLDISDEDVRLSLDLYLAAINSSEDTYQAIREATLRRFPGVTVLSLDAVKVLVRINSALPRTSMHSSDKAMPAFPSNNNAFNVANNSTSLGSQDPSSNDFVISDSALNGSSFVDSDVAAAASVASSTHVELSINPVAQSVSLASSSSLPQCQTSNAIKFPGRGPMRNPNVSGASTSLNAPSSKLTTRSALTQTARLQLKRKGK
ncbi:hypothetical protein C8R42DRAFT_683400 [Lentinula raphanica]|nr:hypothetical protein C8R42DRAFT_683400 [Lentinula raphanica]